MFRYLTDSYLLNSGSKFFQMLVFVEEVFLEGCDCGLFLGQSLLQLGHTGLVLPILLLLLLMLALQ